jgi:hypothetical protein
MTLLFHPSRADGDILKDGGRAAVDEHRQTISTTVD